MPSFKLNEKIFLLALIKFYTLASEILLIDLDRSLAELTGSIEPDEPVIQRNLIDCDKINML